MRIVERGRRRPGRSSTTSRTTTGTPIYVHAKVCIVDDVWMMVGSDNMNRRSWTHDSELSCAVLDDDARRARAARSRPGSATAPGRSPRDTRLRALARAPRPHRERPATTTSLDPDGAVRGSSGAPRQALDALARRRPARGAAAAVTCASTDPSRCRHVTRWWASAVSRVRERSRRPPTRRSACRPVLTGPTANAKAPYRLARVIESPLPTFAPGLDPGSSFVDLLRRVAPHDLPGAGLGARGGGAPLEITHGTTVARHPLRRRRGDGGRPPRHRRATRSPAAASRRCSPADDFSGVAIAGAAGPAVEMVKLFQVQLEHYEKIEGEILSLEGKANQLGQMVRGNLPAAMQGFVVVPLFAGYDDRRDRGRVFSYDVTGGKYEEADFQTNGSGGVHARNWIKATWQRGHDPRRRRRPRAAVAVRRRRRGHRHRRPRPRPAASSRRSR